MADPRRQNGTVPQGADKRSTHYLRHILTFFFLFFNTERIQCYLQCFVALQDGSVAETFKWVVFKETTRKHNNHEDSEVFWGRQDAVSEGPKPLNGLYSFKLSKKLFLKNKQGNTSIPKTAQFVGAAKAQSRRDRKLSMVCVPSIFAKSCF